MRRIGVTLFVVSLALPVWWLVVLSATALPTLDAGIYLSVAGSLLDDNSLYAEVVDNKDPLFYYSLASALAISPHFALALDVLWFALAASGAWLMALRVSRPCVAGIVGWVVSPLVVLGIAYEPGLTNLPGTALVLLGLGFLARDWPIAGGVMLGLAVAIKITLLPVVGALLLVSIAFRTLRSVALRALAAAIGVCVVVVIGLLVLGSLAGYVDVLFDNYRYSGDVMTYFGLTPDATGHMDRIAGDLSPGRWLTIATILGTALLGISVARLQPLAMQILIAWIVVTIIASVVILAATYVWPHHWQTIAVPAVLGVVIVAGLVEGASKESSTRSWSAAVAALVVGLALGGWIAPHLIIERWKDRLGAWGSWWGSVENVPLEARLLMTVPRLEFNFARLGTNDDQGFLAYLPASAQLACPRFHLYDFSPAHHFEAVQKCIGEVDVVLLTASFRTFGQGGRAGYVQPILSIIATEFDCLRVEDRELCVRKS